MNENVELCTEKTGHLLDSDQTKLVSGGIVHNEGNWEAITFYTNQGFDFGNVKFISELIGDSATALPVISIKECPHWKFNRHFHIQIKDTRK